MTNPGQSTPWGQIPIPSEGKVPDIPADLASVIDPIDTLLKNVVGGTTAPTAPLSPTLVDASASIGSLNATQSTQQSQISTLQGQVAALNVAPWAVATRRTDVFSIAGTVGTPQMVLSYQVPAFSQRRMLIVHGTLVLGWSNSTTAAVRGRIQLRADGASTYEDRNQSISSGNVQTMQLHFAETVEAGKSVRVGLACDVFGNASSSSFIETREVDPRLYILALPWSGSALSFLPVQ